MTAVARRAPVRCRRQRCPCRRGVRWLGNHAARLSTTATLAGGVPHVGTRAPSAMMGRRQRSVTVRWVQHRCSRSASRLPTKGSVQVSPATASRLHPAGAARPRTRWRCGATEPPRAAMGAAPRYVSCIPGVKPVLLLPTTLPVVPIPLQPVKKLLLAFEAGMCYAAYRLTLGLYVHPALCSRKLLQQDEQQDTSQRPSCITSPTSFLCFFCFPQDQRSASVSTR